MLGIVPRKKLVDHIEWQSKEISRFNDMYRSLVDENFKLKNEIAELQQKYKDSVDETHELRGKIMELSKEIVLTKPPVEEPEKTEEELGSEYYLAKTLENRMEKIVRLNSLIQEHIVVINKVLYKIDSEQSGEPVGFTRVDLTKTTREFLDILIDGVIIYEQDESISLCTKEGETRYILKPLN